MTRNNPTAGVRRAPRIEGTIYSVVEIVDDMDEDERVLREWAEFSPVLVEPRRGRPDVNRRGGLYLCR